MGTDEEGLPTPATMGEGGTYHIPAHWWWLRHQLSKKFLITVIN
jgi:hypothetical protein